MKSTSSAVHVLNGIIVYSTSRSQKCISLSSTEAEWYSASSGVCDAYYLQHILEFITCGNCNILTLHTDNSAVRMLSLKFGVGRLRHIRGRMLWLQERMASHELNIRQVPTLHNIGDLNTKSHSKNRFLALLYMFGFTTSKDQRVGAEEFSKQQAKELMKKQVNLVGHVLKNGSEFSSASVTGVNQTAKRVLRILSTWSLMDLATGAMYPSDVVVDSADTMSPSPEALGQWLGMSMAMWLQVFFTVVCIAFGIFMIIRGRRHNRQHAVDDIYAPEEQEDGSNSVASASTDWGFPLSEMQERIFHVIDNGCHTEEAICEWMTRRCTRRLAIADSSDRGTVMFYSDCLAALANARRNLLTCDDSERSNIFGYLRNLSRMSPRECSPTREMDMVQLDAAIVEAGRFANETVANLQGPEDIPWMMTAVKPVIPSLKSNGDTDIVLFHWRKRATLTYGKMYVMEVPTVTVIPKQQMFLVSQLKSLCLRLSFICVRFMRGGPELLEGFEDNFKKLTTLALKKRFGSWKLSKIGGQASYDLVHDDSNNSLH